jgi:hypothetical protein
MSPVETSLDLANKITKTNASTIAVNIDTPRMISIDFSFKFIKGLAATFNHQKYH